jgi:hypothetical protein
VSITEEKQDKTGSMTMSPMARVPVYTDENQLHHISIFVEEQDGTFKRTQSEPLRMLRDNIEGISTPQGDIVSPKFDKNERRWRSPTVNFHYGRPQSIYYFLREKIAANRFYVFTKPNLSGRIIQFTLHELKLKQGTSQQILKLLKEKYVEAVDLWSKDQYLSYLNQGKAAGVGSRARKQRLIDRKKRALEELKATHGPDRNTMQDEPRPTMQTFIRYDSNGIDPDESLVHDTGKSKATRFRKTGSRKDEKSTDNDDHKKHFYQRFLIISD